MPDDQLSLAIGKEGQNARLAARLTGWHIDIKNETLAADILRNVNVPASRRRGPASTTTSRALRLRERGRRALPQPGAPGSRYCGVQTTRREGGRMPRDAEDLI